MSSSKFQRKSTRSIHKALSIGAVFSKASAAVVSVSVFAAFSNAESTFANEVDVSPNASEFSKVSESRFANEVAVFSKASEFSQVSASSFANEDAASVVSEYSNA